MPQTLLGQCQQCTARNPALKGPFIAQKNCYGQIAWAHMTSIVVLHSKNLCKHSMHKWLPSKAQVKDAVAYTTNSAGSLFQGKHRTFKLCVFTGAPNIAPADWRKTQFLSHSDTWIQGAWTRLGQLLSKERWIGIYIVSTCCKDLFPLHNRCTMKSMCG